MHPEFTPKDIERFWSKVDRSGGPDACWPWRGKPDKDGYGNFWISKRKYRVHRFSFAIHAGRWAEPMTLHTCHNPPCCNPHHLYEGTNTDNMADMVRANRQARGDRHGARLNPEKLARGDRHGSKTHPERVPRGDQSGRRLHPENYPRGDQHIFRVRPELRPFGERNGRHTHPESTARGDKNGSRLHPELLVRGGEHPNAKLTEDDIREIRRCYESGEASSRALAKRYGLAKSQILRIVHRESWSHVA